MALHERGDGARQTRGREVVARTTCVDGARERRGQLQTCNLGVAVLQGEFQTCNLGVAHYAGPNLPSDLPWTRPRGRFPFGRAEVDAPRNIADDGRRRSLLHKAYH